MAKNIVIPRPVTTQHPFDESGVPICGQISPVPVTDQLPPPPPKES
jgi:hypothetical protein